FTTDGGRMKGLPRSRGSKAWPLPAGPCEIRATLHAAPLLTTRHSLCRSTIRCSAARPRTVSSWRLEVSITQAVSFLIWRLPVSMRTPRCSAVRAREWQGDGERLAQGGARLVPARAPGDQYRETAPLPAKHTLAPPFCARAAVAALLSRPPAE